MKFCGDYRKTKYALQQSNNSGDDDSDSSDEEELEIPEEGVFLYCRACNELTEVEPIGTIPWYCEDCGEKRTTKAQWNDLRYKETLTDKI